MSEATPLIEVVATAEGDVIAACWLDGGGAIAIDPRMTVARLLGLRDGTFGAVVVVAVPGRAPRLLRCAITVDAAGSQRITLSADPSFAPLEALLVALRSTSHGLTTTAATVLTSASLMAEDPPSAARQLDRIDQALRQALERDQIMLAAAEAQLVLLAERD